MPVIERKIAVFEHLRVEAGTPTLAEIISATLICA